MFVYILVSLVLFGIGFSEKLVGEKTRLFMSIFVFVLLVCFDGLRWENGTDWDNYHDFFRNILDSEYEIFEIGYKYFNILIRSIVYNYTVFLMVFAIIMYSILWWFFKYYSEGPLFSFFLFFVLFVSVQGMNRQFMAIMICLISTYFLVLDKKLLFVLCVWFASLFHTTAFLFLVGLFLRKTYSFKFYSLILGGTILLSMSGFVVYAVDTMASFVTGGLATRLSVYSESDDGTGGSTIIAIIRRLIWVLPILYIMKKQEEELPRHIILFFNMYFLGVLVYILFNGSILQIFVSRGTLYFMIFECILIPYLIYNYTIGTLRYVAMGLVLVYGLFNMNKGINGYTQGNDNIFLPYKSVYYNTDVHKKMY